MWRHRGDPAVRWTAITRSLLELTPAFADVFPGTRYFEIDSAVAGARYAIWVTPPPAYACAPGQRYPAIFLPDGNDSLAVVTPAHRLLGFDPIQPIAPHMTVCVGYTGDDAGRSLAVRARDLLPPGEALPPYIEQAVEGTLALGLLDREGADLYLKYLRNPAGDRFLAFLTEELQPQLAEQFPIDADSSGLYGYSYGGLFASYAALHRPPTLPRIGAGSPGILAGASQIFALYDAELASGREHAGRHLHVTVCERELTVASYYQTMVGAGAVELIARAGARPLPGLRFSSRILADASHASGFAASWFSYLRACHAATPTSDARPEPT